MTLQKNFKKCMRVYRSNLVDYAPSNTPLERDPYELGFSITQHARPESAIPFQYKCSSKQERQALLAGVVDARGLYNKKTKQFEIKIKKADTLKSDIIWIARSLGLQCYVSVNHKIYIVGNGLHEFPVRIPDNQAANAKCSRDLLRRRFRVEQVNDGDFYGFELDNNHLFVLGNGELD